MVVARCTTSKHRQWLIDVLCMRIAGHNCSRSVGLFDQIVAVIGVDARSAGRRFVDASPEGVVLEADGPAGTWQCHARQTVLEVPGIGGGVRAGHAGERVAVGVVRVRRARR